MYLLFSELPVYVLGSFAIGDLVSFSLQSVDTRYNGAINPDVGGASHVLSTRTLPSPQLSVCLSGIPRAGAWGSVPGISSEGVQCLE